MNSRIAVVAALTMIVGNHSNLLADQPPQKKTFDELRENAKGRYSRRPGAYISKRNSKGFSEITAHQLSEPITIALGGSGIKTAGPAAFYSDGCSVWSFGLRSNLVPHAYIVSVRRAPVYYKNLLQKERDVLFDTTTEFHFLDQGETFRMPDNTEWRVLAIDVEKKGITFEVVAVPGTLDPGLKNSKNNSLFVPLDSKVSLHVHGIFGPADPSALYTTISARSSRDSKTGNIRLVVKGVSCLDNPDQVTRIQNEEYSDIKVGQKIELTPAHWHKIKKIVRRDRAKGIRGWIEFDTTPVGLSK